MTRSSDSLVPSASGQPDPEKRDDKALTCWQEGEANLRAATEVNAVTASSYPPAIMPIQLDLFPGRACPLEAKPATDRNAARVNPDDTSTVTADVSSGFTLAAFRSVAGFASKGQARPGKRSS